MAEQEQVAQENEESLKRFMRAPQDFDEQQERGAILFADMVGSTAFKYGHSAIEALVKTYRHNTIIQNAIERSDAQGEVVKFLGDGVMAWFSGERAAQHALQVGLRAVADVEAHNQREVPAGNWEYKINTRIGVHVGPVWLMKFRQATRVDPQGPAVDIAARLCSVAPPMTVVVNHETFAEVQAELDPSTYVCSGPHSHPLKGIPNNQRLYVLTLPDKEPIKLPLPGSIRPLPVHLRAQLDTILGQWRANRENDQIQAQTIHSLRAFLNREAFNFEANYRLAELLTYRQGDGRSMTERAKEAADCLRKCKAEHPEAAELWKLLSWVYYQWFLADPKNNTSKLDQAVGYARHALSLAEGLMDEHGAMTAKILLVIYLNERIRLGSGNKDDDYGYALRYVKEVQPLVQRTGPGAWLLSNFYVGWAMTVVAQQKSSKNVEEALALLKKASEHYDRNALAARLNYELLS